MVTREDSAIPSIVVFVLFVAALFVPGGFGTALQALLLGVVVLGAVSIFFRLKARLGSPAVRAVIALGIAALPPLLAVVLGGWWQVPALAIYLVLAWLGIDQLLDWWERRRPDYDLPGGYSRPGADERPCPTPSKVKFATHYDADQAVLRSLERHSQGRSDYAEPLGGSYPCGCGFWHVTRG